MKNFINRAFTAKKKFYVVLCTAMMCVVNVFAQSESENTNVNCGSAVTITAAPAAGYHFVKWTKGGADFAGNTAKSLTVTNIKGDSTYVAHFALDETVVDPSIDPGVTLPVTHGTILHLTPTTDDDCQQFSHWSDIDDPTDPNYAANPRDFEYNGVAPTFTAIFTTKVYNVVVNTETGDTTEGTVTVSIVP